MNHLTFKQRIVLHTQNGITKMLAFAMLGNIFGPITAYGNREGTPPEPIAETLIGDTSLVARTALEGRMKRKYVTLTFYSSEPEQTDDTPFITASNKRVRRGIIASNDYPFGTRMMFPEIYGDEVFEVYDRMHARFTGVNRMDMWVPDPRTARNLGIKRTVAVILQS